jgi:hypothetical protein
MAPEIVTASAVISLVERLEDSAEAFYQDLAARFEEHSALFQGYAKESAKIKTSIVRTYRETITDAIEACFSFEGMVLGQYAINTDLPEGASLADGLKSALEIETTTVSYYAEVEERSKALLATIPRAFNRATKKRTKRKAELEALLGAG